MGVLVKGPFVGILAHTMRRTITFSGKEDICEMYFKHQRFQKPVFMSKLVLFKLQSARIAMPLKWKQMGPLDQILQEEESPRSYNVKNPLLPVLLLHLEFLHLVQIRYLQFLTRSTRFRCDASLSVESSPTGFNYQLVTLFHRAKNAFSNLTVK